MTSALTLFDLDNTLLAGDSDYEWGQFLVECGVLLRADYEAQNARFYEQYKDGSLDIHEYLQFALGPLAAHEPQALAGWREEFMRARIRPMMLPRAQEVVARHLQAGELCAIVTATNSFVTQPIARAFGVEHLVATEPEMVAGRFTGRIAGTPCFREGKLRRVDEWLAGLGRRFDEFDATRFYSDSHNDLPLLKLVTDPVAVDPDPVLKEYAEQHGWPVISLR